MCRSTIQRYYLEPKKKEIIRGFLWSKVFLDKCIANRTIGQSLRVDFPKSKPSLYNQKKEGETLIYWLEFQFGIEMDSSIGRAELLHWIQSTWQHAHRAFDEVFTCARAVCDSASTYLVVCRFNPSTNSLTALRGLCGRAAGN